MLIGTTPIDTLLIYDSSPYKKLLIRTTSTNVNGKTFVYEREVYTRFLNTVNIQYGDGACPASNNNSFMGCMWLITPTTLRLQTSGANTVLYTTSSITEIYGMKRL